PSENPSGSATFGRRRPRPGRRSRSRSAIAAFRRAWFARRSSRAEGGPVADYEIPTDLRYTREDEWVRVEGDRAMVGVTDYAQQQLGDIVNVELPPVGTPVERGEPFGVIES